MSLRPVVGALSLLFGLGLYLFSIIILETVQRTIHLIDPLVYLVFATVFAVNGFLALTNKTTRFLVAGSALFLGYCFWKVFVEYRAFGDFTLFAIIFMGFGALTTLIAALELIEMASSKK